MASCHERVPNLPTWSTDSNLKYRHYNIKNQVAPVADMCPEIDKNIAFPGRCEDSKILKQDGKFDEEGHKAVDNRGDIDPLSFLSVSILPYWL